MEPHGIHLSSKADLTVKWKSINKTNSLDRQMHYWSLTASGCSIENHERNLISTPLIVEENTLLNRVWNLIYYSNWKYCRKMLWAVFFCVTSTVRMAEWSKAPDSRAKPLRSNATLGVLVSEWRRGFESHFWHYFRKSLCFLSPWSLQDTSQNAH